ncbi:LysR family transcriptional regulator [uncultured Alteromonas sp.]|jgi:DNA-binding transcriptional LysR family regulator|uniref:LysR family transcriptional regulator n=1 Tax=uncultured Alteromonas sp. TaxID=179113 RepID=UPI0030D7F101
MDRIQAMSVFAEAAKLGSFVSAAEQLSMSAPAVTRAIATLEAQLNTRLFHRTTRRIRLTEAGIQYLNDVQRILADIAQSEAATAGVQLLPKGTLSVTAPVLFGELYITPIIAQFLRDFPEVNVHGYMYDNIVDLLDTKIDVAIRISKPKDSGLYATTVGYVRKVTVASPDYLANAPNLKTPEDLKHHTLLYPSDFKEPPVWNFKRNGKTVAIRLQPRFECNQNRSTISAAKSGLGITRLMSYQVADAIEKGELVSVLDEFNDEKLPIQVVSLEGRHNLEKVKKFVEYVKSALAKDVYLNS